MLNIKFVDGTLREGEQSPGVFFTLEEKIEIAQELDRAGVDILDVGMPSVGTQERNSITAVSRLGLSASVGVSVRMKTTEVDQALQCGADEVFIITPVSRLHIRKKLGMDEDTVKRKAGKVVSYAAQKGLVANLVAEDAARSGKAFLKNILLEARDCGARRAFICDTVGVMEPFSMYEMVAGLREAIPEDMDLGIHCHNDLGLATANTLAAIKAGAKFPTVTVNGIGERAGNAPLHEVVMGVDKLLGLEHRVQKSALYELTKLVERCSGVFIPPHSPLIGLNCFRHESGTHVHGLLKDTRTYAAIDPGEIKREQVLVLGKHSGSGSVRRLLQERGYQADQEAVDRIVLAVKEYKTQQGKEQVRRMLNEIDTFYQQVLNFPPEAFWTIVREVLGSD